MTKTGSILPEETLNAILRTGSNHNRTELRLIYNFMSVQTKEEYKEFVRNEYGNGGKGFIIDGKKYAVWFNKNGMQIALGETFPWLLSYDDTQEIRDVYNKEHCVNLQLNYSVNSHRKAKELLFSNMEIRSCL